MQKNVCVDGRTDGQTRVNLNVTPLNGDIINKEEIMVRIRLFIDTCIVTSRDKLHCHIVYHVIISYIMKCKLKQTKSVTNEFHILGW